MKMSVIMPALNEEKNISGAILSTLKAFDRFEINAEIVIVNDGSSDNTRSLIEQKAREDPQRIRVVNHSNPKGIGTSFWDGVDYAAGDIIVMLPGDGENDPAEIFRYYKLLEHVDIVIPFIFNRETRFFLRNTLSFAYRFVVNTTFLVNFNYTNGTILYRKSVIDELNHRGRGFFFQTDILIRAVKKGYLFAEVPYKLGSRKEGISKAISFPSLWQVIKGYLRLVKDYYFDKSTRQGGCFSSDSLTVLRRQNPQAMKRDDRR